MKYLFLLLIFHTFGAFATVFGEDNRIEYHQMSNDIQNLAMSSVAIIPKDRLIETAEGYVINAKSLKEHFQFCDETNFSQQLLLANCSAALIDNNKILTAAHCIVGEKEQNEYYAVFNYKKYSETQTKLVFKKEDVFNIKKELFFDFDRTLSKTAMDLAIFELDRKASYPVAKLNFSKPELGEPVFVLGYPLGVYLKYADNSVIKHTNLKQNSFRYELDTFSVNSGSPIFNSRHEIIGVHVRGTGLNYREVQDRKCNDWGRGKSGSDYGEANNILKLKKIISEFEL